MDGNKFLFDRIAEAVQATGQGDKYSRGMCNGMLFVKSLIDGKEPEYFKSAEAGTRQNSPVALTCAGAYPAYNSELRKAAEPLYDYLLRRGDPHTCVVVTRRGATLKRDESGVAFVKGGVSEREEAFEREIREIAGGGKAQEEADEKKFLKSIANIRPTVDVERGKDGKLGARIVELKELLHERENALSMYREESEKRLYEIMELRGKVAAYEKAIDCVRAFGGK